MPDIMASCARGWSVRSACIRIWSSTHSLESLFFKHKNKHEQPGGHQSAREEGTATVGNKTNSCDYKQKQNNAAFFFVRIIIIILNKPTIADSCVLYWDPFDAMCESFILCGLDIQFHVKTFTDKAVDWQMGQDIWFTICAMK